MTKVDAILTADWHLREDVPVCRTDDYWVAQEKKVDFIFDLAAEHGCPVWIAGDMFNRAKPPLKLVNFFVRKLGDSGVDIVIVPGQHDLPQHNMSLINHSALGTLHEARIINTTGHEIISMFAWGEELRPNEAKVALAHTLCYKGRPPWPGAPASGNASAIMEKLQGYDLVVTGDNHKPFTYRHHDGRLLVNPGSIMRMTIAQEKHRPRVYLWNAEENEVEAVFLPIEKDVITKEHIESKEQRDERMEAFIERIDTEYTKGLSFEDNLEQYFATNNTRKGVEEMVWKAMETK